MNQDSDFISIMKILFFFNVKVYIIDIIIFHRLYYATREYK